MLPDFHGSICKYLYLLFFPPWWFHLVWFSGFLVAVVFLRLLFLVTCLAVPQSTQREKKPSHGRFKVQNKSKYFNFKSTFPLNALQTSDLPSRELYLFLVHRVRRPFFANCQMVNSSEAIDQPGEQQYKAALGLMTLSEPNGLFLRSPGDNKLHSQIDTLKHFGCIEDQKVLW